MLRQPINREEWLKDSTTINAFYRPIFNEISKTSSCSVVARYLYISL